MKYTYLLSVLMLMGCGLNTGNPYLDATVTGASAIYKSQGAVDKCTQGHAQDRVDCRNRKTEQTDALSKSLKKHTEK